MRGFVACRILPRDETIACRSPPSPLKLLILRRLCYVHAAVAARFFPGNVCRRFADRSAVARPVGPYSSHRGDPRNQSLSRAHGYCWPTRKSTHTRQCCVRFWVCPPVSGTRWVIIWGTCLIIRSTLRSTTVRERKVISVVEWPLR